MNLFKTTDNGGLPLVLNDFRWIDIGYREAFKGIMSSYGIEDSKTIILSGCERTVLSGNVTIATGFVSIGGEICFVPDHSYIEPVGGVLEYWDLNISHDAEGYKAFQSTSNFDTYQKRIAKITTASSIPSGYTKYQDTETVFQVIKNKIPKHPWLIVSTQTIGLDGLIPGTYVLRAKKDFDGFVHLEGIRYNEDEDFGIIANLPEGHRPTVTKTYTIATLNTPTIIGHSIVRIHLNGDIEIVRAGTGAAALMDFSQIPPFAGI